MTLQKVSLMVYPDEPVDDILGIVRLAESIGLHACYFTDSTFRKDPWVLMGAAAKVTSRIRLGPSAVRIRFRDPLLTAQALATLDELSDGRVEAVIGSGPTFGKAGSERGSRPQNPAAIMKEGLEVIRIFLAEGRVEHEGEYFTYYYKAKSSARPKQRNIPLSIGTMGGPKSIQMAGEVADGMHVAPGYTSAAARFAVEKVREGAANARRTIDKFDTALSPVWVCGDDGEAARKVATVQAAFYLPKIAPDFIRAQGVDPARIKPIADAWADGDIDRAVSLVEPELMSLVAIAGTPEECASKLREHFHNGPVSHLVLMIADPLHAQLLTGRKIRGVPSVQDQLRVFSDRVMPTLDLTAAQ